MRNIIRSQLLIVAATVCGLLAANLPVNRDLDDILSSGNSSYDPILLHCSIYDFNLDIRFLDFVNDFLMTFFFLIIGIEIKHEAKFGALSQKDSRILPIVGAIGGVLCPMVIYYLIVTQWDFLCAILTNIISVTGAANMFDVFNPAATSTSIIATPSTNTDMNIEILRGLPIPCATDIAFTIAAVEILKRYIPNPLRIFVITLAVVDDLISILIITIFYTKTSFSLYNGVVLMIFIAIIFLLQFIQKRKFATKTAVAIYIAALLCIWLCLEYLQIHPTLSGVLIAFLMPTTKDSLPSEMEHQTLNSSASHLTYFIFSKAVGFVILPLFAFLNSQVTLNFTSMYINWAILSAVCCGLCIGKQIGIYSITRLFIQLLNFRGFHGISKAQIYAASTLCGIGFTMSIFMSLLAFSHNETYIESAKIGVILGSLISFLLAYLIAKIYIRGEHIKNTK